MQKETKVLEILRSLTEASRNYWSDGKRYGFDACSAEDHFEMELVRAEDFLKEEKTDANL